MEAQPIAGAESAALAGDVLSVLRADGSADPAHDPGLGAERTASLYEAMVTSRVVGERLAALTAEGMLGFFPPSHGNEAAVIGATAALREHDWIFPSHGDYGAALLRGLPIAALVHRAFGDALDPILGRDMPAGLSARAQRIASVSAPAATHLPHAVGVAWAARLRGEDLVTAAFFDAHEIAAGDFHTGLNFAGVMRAKTIFACRTRAGEESAAERAIEYGIASARCDGSDLLAVVRTMSEAMERAMRGEGATVIDLVLGEPDAALSRMRAHVERLGAWSDERERTLRRKIEGELNTAIAEARTAGVPALETMHEHVYAKPTAHLTAQRAELERAPRARKH